MAVPNPGILMSAMLWPTWVRHAVENEAAAASSRSDLLAGYPGSLDAMSDEMANAQLAICCAAIAMECLAIDWTEPVMPADVATSWNDKGKRTAATGRVRELLKRVCATGKAGNQLADRWVKVFELRGEAVHYVEELGPPGVHPAGIGKCAELYVRYSVEAATAAVDLLFATLAEARTADQPVLHEWLQGRAAVLDELTALRSAP